MGGVCGVGGWGSHTIALMIGIIEQCTTKPSSYIDVGTTPTHGKNMKAGIKCLSRDIKFITHIITGIEEALVKKDIYHFCSGGYIVMWPSFDMKNLRLRSWLTNRI